MKIAVVIPARGGSKGVIGKNRRLLAEKPLIVHTIEQANESTLVADIYVTTDSQSIGNIARQAGAIVIERPERISGDECSSESALLHCLDFLKKSGKEYQLIVFLQCTSPFRRKTDIDDAINKVLDEQADSLLSVIPSHKFLWRNTSSGVESINYDYMKRPRRQDMEVQYQENGSIYIFKPWVLERTGNRLGGKISMFVMDEKSAVDIDSDFDFTLADKLFYSLHSSDEFDDN